MSFKNAFSRQPFSDTTNIPTAALSLPGRTEAMITATYHAVSGTPLAPPYPPNYESILLGLGCFWGVERLFWRLEDVYLTAVGYAGGTTPNPLYKEVCSGRTGHAEVVLVVFDPLKINYQILFKTFWEAHDPTQGMRQGNDIGSQYRSAIYSSTAAQSQAAMQSKERYQTALDAHNYGAITTEIAKLTQFYFAEDYHQQYLEKNPNGYCGFHSTKVAFPEPLHTAAELIT